MSHPNATLVPQARQARPSGEILNYLLSLCHILLNDHWSRWVSDVLGGDLVLIQHPPDTLTERRARGKYLKTYPRTFPDTCVPTYSDVTPYMFTTQPSLHDLKTRLPVHVSEHVTQVNFRPNIVITGDNLQPWDEDR